MIFDLGLDLFPLMTATLAALTCGLLGNFLVLRRQSMMGDAISHAVLPGLVMGLLVTSSLGPVVMLVGAAAAGIAAVVLIELVKGLGRVEPGAAMGVVFSVMFALGVLLMQQAAAGNVHLDADCVLYGQLETLVWFEAPPTLAGLWSVDTLAAMPRQVVTLLVVFAAAVAFVLLLFKELRITAFDPGLATTQGVHAGVMHYVLMIFVAAATVASFEAVGSILVIAMLIAPAATARLLTDRLGSQVLVSLVAALFSGVVGYFAATYVPQLLDANSVNAAGSMTVVAGLLVVLAAFFSPSHGLVARGLRRRRLGRLTMLDDLLAQLYRREERESAQSPPHKPLAPGDRRGDPPAAVRLALRGGLVHHADGELRLTDAGRAHAAGVLRKHRLWEHYLVTDAGLQADHVHDPAEALEHLPLAPRGPATTDPHGKPIPDRSPHPRP